MGRPRKIFEDGQNEGAVAIDKSPEESEPIPTPAVQKEEQKSEPPKKSEKVSILANPYLTDEQKMILINHELSKLINVPTPNQPQTVVFRYMGPNGVPLTTLATCHVNAVSNAWEFYKNNTRNPTLDDFFKAISKLVSHIAFKGVGVPEIALE